MSRRPKAKARTAPAPQVGAPDPRQLELALERPLSNQSAYLAVLRAAYFPLPEGASGNRPLGDVERLLGTTAFQLRPFVLTLESQKRVARRSALREVEAQDGALHTRLPTQEDGSFEDTHGPQRLRSVHSAASSKDAAPCTEVGLTESEPVGASGREQSPKDGAPCG